MTREERRSWWRRRRESFLEGCSGHITDRIGRGNLDAVILCGSFCTNEETIVLERREPLLLSDVDIAVVVSSIEVLKELLGRKRSLGSACEELVPEVGFVGRVEVGFYLAGELGRLPPRPGVYEMREIGRVLDGDPAMLEKIPRYEPSKVGGRETNVLIENRIIPHLHAYPGCGFGGEEEQYRFLYQMARVYTDIATAVLCLAGMYRPGYGARLEHLKKENSGGDLCGLVSPAVLESIEMWTRFKINPSLEAVGGTIGCDRACELWRTGASDLLDVWIRGERRKQAISPGKSGDADIEPLLHSRPRHGKLLDNLRRWRFTLFGYSRERRLRIATVLGRNFLKREPLDLIREYGVRLIHHSVKHGVETPVSGPPGGFPYSGGDWLEAVRQLYGIWSELVFGRKDA